MASACHVSSGAKSLGVDGWSCMSASEVMTETVYRSEPQAQGGDYRPAVILQVLPELDAGGVERGTVDIARAIVDGGGKALVASQGGRLERELDRFGAKHITLPLKSKNILTMRKNIDPLVKLIREQGFRWSRRNWTRKNYIKIFMLGSLNYLLPFHICT